jgi:hypothetical protein
MAVIQSLKTRRASDLALLILIITDLMKMKRGQLALLRLHQLAVMHARRRRLLDQD